jgi:hypothetical protein
MMRPFAILVLCLGLPGPAVAAPDSYICAQDMSTGFRFEDRRWQAVRFHPERKYLVSRSQRPNAVWEVKNVGHNSATVWCKSDFNDDGDLFCEGFADFWMNRNNLRFQYVYPFGYVDGLDHAEDTPSISIGKCSPL